MSRIVIITVSPRDPATGAVSVQRLAGGGQSTPYYFRGEHWRAGVADIPRFRTAIGWDDSGWTGGSIPTTATIGFAPSTPEALQELARLYWRDAPIVIEAAEEGSGDPAFALLTTGTVASATQADGQIVMTLTDLGGPLDRPVLSARFAGTGSIEGGEEASGRLKRRTWGRAYNLEGRIFDKAYNIYEFGDPARALQSIDELRDIGRAGSRAVLAWQGSAAATLAALRGVAVPAGGGVVAPSIAMARWWTQPNGPLTADVHGEIGTGYVETAPEIAALVTGTASVTVANVSAAKAMRGGVAGYHIDSDTETVANALDRLLLPISLTWALDTDGTMRFLPITLDAPVETVRSLAVRRQKALPPMSSRRVGYQRAWRTHSDGEISSTLYAADVAFSDGRPVEVLKDVEPGATVGAPEGTTVAGTPAEDVLSALATIDASVAAEIMRGGLFRVDTERQYTDEDGVTVLQKVAAIGVSVNGVVAFVEDTRSVGTDGSLKAFTKLNSQGHIIGTYLTNDGTEGKAYTVADEWGIIDPAYADDPDAAPTKPLYYVDGILYLDHARVRQLDVDVVNTINVADGAITRRKGVQLASPIAGNGASITALSYTLTLPFPAEVVMIATGSCNYTGSIPSVGVILTADGAQVAAASVGAGAFLPSFAVAGLRTLAAGSHTIALIFNGGSSDVSLSAASLIVDGAMK